jgi:magnesium transporter
MSINCRLYVNGRLEEAEFDKNKIDQVLTQPGSLVWLDVADPTEQKLDFLAEEFGFHPLTVEDSLQAHQRPKIEQYDTYYFLIVYGMTIEGERVMEHELAVFASHNYLVTVRKPPGYDLDQVVKRWEANSELTAEGGGYLMYVLLDEIVDGYFDVLDNFEDRAEVVEDKVFKEGTGDVQNELFALKKDLVRYRRLMAPLREALDVMQRRSVHVVRPKLEPYYRDVYDHVLRATDFADSLRDILSSVLDGSLALISNRLNEVMKHLTSWGAIILVPTLIAGIYGMNFRHMPELDWYFGYPFALALMLISAGMLRFWFKKKGWL